MRTLRRATARLAGLVVVTAALVVGQGVVTPAQSVEILQDGGFEAAVLNGTVLDSPNWTEADTAFGSPLCDNASCGTGGGASPPHTGNIWAWFGGIPTANQVGSLSQAVNFPNGTASLTYWYRNGTVSAPFDATLVVAVDGTPVKTHTEAATAEAAYSLQTVNLSAYANGASHTLSFTFSGNTGAATTSMVVDDVSINVIPTTTKPTVSGTTPASPSSSTTPLVTGTSEAGSTVTLYSNAACTSAALGTGSAAAFAAAGVTATVPANATTTIFAKASKAGQNDSACSTTSVSYTNDSTAPGAPSLTSVTPSSPGTATNVAIKGSAEAGSTVKLYLTSDCSGGPAATGTAAALGGAGINVTVPANVTSTIKATATDAAANVSSCSSGIGYTHDSTAPAEPSALSVSPTSPDVSTTPVVTGTAEAGSTVKVYATTDCTGSPEATGSAGAFGSPGLTVTVAAGSTTTFKATATDAVGNVSACSTSSATYTQGVVTPPPPATAPDTALTKSPKKKVKTTKHKAKVSFSFSSATAGATFECSIDGKAFTPCVSGMSFKAKVGQHTFAVRAVAGGLTDPTPAAYSFKVKRKPRH